MIQMLRDFCRVHALALLFAFAVGALYVVPHISFIVSLGDAYRGIPLLQTQNEDYYLTRIREIIDGHYSTGSFLFHEYKDAPPLTPPTEEFLYAIPTLLFGTSVITTIIVSRFVLPFGLFLLIYFLLVRLTSTKRREENGHGDAGTERTLAQKLTAISGSLLITLGYDLINYRAVWRYLLGEDSLAGSFLMWSRLVHPIWGAIFLFLFLLCLYALMCGTKRIKSVVLLSSALLALMFGSYFFSWGLAVSIGTVLFVIAFFRKEFSLLKQLFVVFAGGVLLSSPYWWNAWVASQSPWYELALLRGGLFVTHYPMWNKFMLAVLGLYILLVWLIPLLQKWWRGGIHLPVAGKETFELAETWQWFLLAVIAGSLWVYVEQVITGKTIWPYHFAQYTIPLGIIASLVLGHRLVRPKLSILWWSAMGIIALASVTYGIAVQATVYSNSFPHYLALQKDAPILERLNAEKGECVVFFNKNDLSARNWNFMVTAFTSCDIYAEDGPSLLMPFERIYHGYLATLRLRGLQAKDIQVYIRDNPAELRQYLFGNWKGLYNRSDFPDITDTALTERIAKLPEDYTAFMKQDFREVLNRYALDYILSSSPLLSSVLKELPGTELIEQAGDLFLYRFK